MLGYSIISNQKIFMAMKKVLFILLITTSILSAQDLQTVFSDSYTYEYKQEYELAIEELIDVYYADSYDLNLRLGWLYHLSGEQIKSVKYYEYAIELMPYSIEAKLGLVYPLDVMGSWSKVISVYNEVLEIDSNNVLANYSLASIAKNRKEFEKAKYHLLKIVNFYPSDVEANLLLAWTFFDMKEIQDAKEVFENVLLISPEDNSALEGLKKIKATIVK